MYKYLNTSNWQICGLLAWRWIEWMTTNCWHCVELLFKMTVVLKSFIYCWMLHTLSYLSYYAHKLSYYRLLLCVGVWPAEHKILSNWFIDHFNHQVPLLPWHMWRADHSSSLCLEQKLIGYCLELWNSCIFLWHDAKLTVMRVNWCDLWEEMDWPKITSSRQRLTLLVDPYGGIGFS